MKKLIVSVIVAAFATFSHAADAERLQLAREVIKATQADKVIDAMTAQVQQMVTAQLEAQAAKMPPEVLAQLQGAQRELVGLAMESAKGMLVKLDHVYADVYTEKELRAIKTFFESPEGRSMLEKQTVLMQRMMPLMMEMQEAMAPKIEEIMKRHTPQAKTGH
jgi:hypothetical protein